jgi:3'-phosphoadenosine 5'-phosphosulfate sulfotransferase (PAPS reductase)/FAD synthetase
MAMAITDRRIRLMFLYQKQSLPLRHKIMLLQRSIRDWYEQSDGKVYIAFSGGKDSTVFLHLVRSLYPDLPAVYVDTGLEYPAIREFAKSVESVEII